MNGEFSAEAKRIADFLSGYLTDGGVVDPDEGCVLPHSYTTDFYAWLCALLYKRGYGDEWLHRAIQAMRPALNFVAEPSYPTPASSTTFQFHWEFKNVALIQLEHLVGDELPETLRAQLHRALLNWQNLNIDSTNWTAMRALSYEMRYQRFGRLKDRWRSQLELKLVLNRQTPEGFFPDTPHSHSMQYHAYVLSLLALYHRLTGDALVRAAFLRGTRLVSDFINPAGDFNYYGRGQRQLFGYASLILALSEAANMGDDPAEAGRYRLLCRRSLQFVCEHRQADGVFPVVLNDAGGCWGWYDYNNRGDYLAFCGVWFLLASALPQLDMTLENQAESYTHCYPELGLAVAARPDWFAVFSARGDDLAEPVGLIHLWPTGPICLGGPEPARSMGTDYTHNYLGPLTDGYPLLQRRRGKLNVEGDRIYLSFSHSALDIEQIYSLSNGLSLDQKLVPKFDLPAVTLLSIAGGFQPSHNWGGSLEAACPSPIGPVIRFVGETRSLSQPVTVRTQLAAGKSSSPGTQPSPTGARPGVWRWLWGKALKMVWEIWIRLIR